MQAHSANVYRNVLTAQRLPAGIGVVSLARLAVAFSQMAKDLRSQKAPPDQEKVFRSAIARAAESRRRVAAANGGTTTPGRAPAS